MKEIKRLLHKNLFIISIVLLIICGSSCKNISVPIQVTNSNTPYVDLIQIRAAILNYNQVRRNDSSLYTSSPSSARSINPKLQANDYDFYLFGQKKINDFSQTFGPIQINITTDENGDSGSFSTQIPSGTWYLTLAAYNSETPVNSITGATLKSSALLIGNTLADFSQTNSNITFTLNASGLTTPGKVNLKLKLEDWKLSDFENGMKVKAELVNTQTNTSIAVKDNLDKTYDDLLEYYPLDEITPGVYLFKLTFYNFTGTTNSFSWTDKLTVYPGTITDQQVFIPKVMNSIPEKPENFTFQLEDYSALGINSDYYLGTFNWTIPDTGTTASEYELRLYDEGSGKEYITYTRKNEGSILVHSGSLDSYSTSIQFWLPLGKKLSAQIRAKNRTGTSDEDWTSEETKIENINLYRVTYNLQGGRTLNDSVFGTGTSGTSGAICYYASIANPHEWKTPDANDIKDPDDKTFDFWSTSPAEDASQLDTEADEGKYTGFENIELYAKYKTSVLHPLKNEEGTLSIEYNLNDEVKTILPETNIINIPVNTKLNIFITPTGFNYDSIVANYWAGLSNVPYSDENNYYVFEKETSGLESGEKEIIFEATFDNAGTMEISKLKIILNITE